MDNKESFRERLRRIMNGENVITEDERRLLDSLNVDYNLSEMIKENQQSQPLDLNYVRGRFEPSDDVSVWYYRRDNLSLLNLDKDEYKRAYNVCSNHIFKLQHNLSTYDRPETIKNKTRDEYASEYYFNNKDYIKIRSAFSKGLITAEQALKLLEGDSHHRKLFRRYCNKHNVSIITN